MLTPASQAENNHAISIVNAKLLSVSYPELSPTSINIFKVKIDGYKTEKEYGKTDRDEIVFCFPVHDGFTP